LGIISKQASFNAFNIVIATIAGAINTIVILPRAFEDDPDDWGLIKLITSYALTGAQIFCLGAPNVILRYFPKFKDGNANGLVTFALLLPLTGIALIAIALFGFTGSLEYLTSPEDAGRLQDQVLLLFAIFTSQTFFVSLYGYIVSQLKTTLFLFLSETFQKSAYLLLALLFLFEYLNYTELLYAYTGVFTVQFVVLAIQCLSVGYRPSFKFRLLPKREIIVYGLYSIFDRSAAVVVASMDIMMIGALIGLDDVAFYTLAYYIGAVTLIPQKSISVIANPLVSKAIENDDREHLQELYTKTSLNQLIIGGMVFMAVWANVDDIMSLVPEKFQGGKWIILYIGMSRLFTLISGVNGGMIIYSKWFRANLVMNGTLIGLTALLNYLFLSDKYFGMGIDGAALATAITFFCYFVIKTIFVYQKFRMHQFSSSLLIVLILLAGLSYGGYSISLPIGALWAIIAKSAMVYLVFVGVVFAFRLSPDLNELVKRTLKR
jgi:O-antigen/teichoic acid export membrane protein